MATDSTEPANVQGQASSCEVTMHDKEAVWQQPEFEVVETALEVTAYSLADR
ncbi:pyrroloquinoline quinone precursor peptide PqqA [Streptomyces sp. NPDC056491]|uniref:pyrroloquinoline quinone precursor peptide PqqA n=1 Tax=Streptomyces sp. NPDC056491 TaxID=3345837 RepID=UPI00367FC250